MTNKMFEIKVEDYLTEDEIKEIVKEEVRSQVRCHNEQDFKRVLMNASYDWFKDLISETMGDDFNEQIEVKIKEVLSEVTAFHVIREGSFGESPSKAYKLIQEYVNKHKQILENRVKNSLENMSEYDILRYKSREDLADSVSQAIFNTIMKGAVDDE